jgi:hypothetical protein
MYAHWQGADTQPSETVHLAFEMAKSKPKKESTE